MTDRERNQGMVGGAWPARLLRKVAGLRSPQPSSKMAHPPVFRAEPEMIEVDESGLGETSLTWETPDVAVVEIRVFGEVCGGRSRVRGRKHGNAIWSTPLRIES